MYWVGQLPLLRTLHILLALGWDYHDAFRFPVLERVHRYAVSIAGREATAVYRNPLF